MGIAHAWGRFTWWMTYQSGRFVWWLLNDMNATDVQAICAVIALPLTGLGLWITYINVSVARQLAKTTHLQLTSMLQPTVELGLKMEIVGRQEYRGVASDNIDASVLIRNLGASPVKLKGVYVVVQEFVEGDVIGEQYQVELESLRQLVVLPAQKCDDTFLVDLPRELPKTGSYVIGLRVRCTDLSEQLAHLFTWHPTRGLRHSSEELFGNSL